MSYELNRKDSFVDITEGFSIRYNDSEIIDGHRFIHICNGIYAADPCFIIIDEDELKKLTSNYQDIEFLAFKDGENIRIIYAYSIHLIPHGGESSKFNYLINSKNCELKKYYSKDMNPYDLYRFDYQKLFDKFGKTSKDSIKESGALIQHYYYTDDAFSDNMVLILDGVPGYLVEEGIYYFPEYNPTISFDSKYEEEIAIIGEAPYNLRYTFSIFGVIYAAVGRKHFERLKKILQEFGESSNLCYFELERISSNPKDKQKEETYIRKTDQYRLDGNELEDNSDYYIPKGAVELIEGIGFTDVTLRFSRPFIKDKSFKTYKIAYIYEDELFLISDNYMSYGIEVHKLDYISGLYVLENRELSCGITYPVIHRVIDEGKEKYKSIMKEEAYSDYIFESLQDEVVELLQEVKGFDINLLVRTMKYASMDNNRLLRLKEYLMNNSEATFVDILNYVFAPNEED